MTDLLAYRDRFPILSDCTYLINHSLAAMPAAGTLTAYPLAVVDQAIRAYGASKHAQGEKP